MRSMTRWRSDVFARLRLTPRSNGVAVRRDTAALIRKGNRAREAQAWARAARAYSAALAIEPHLQHLWIQLGHMEKEAGALDRATHAYEEAAQRRPEDIEPLLRLGHMAKAWRQPIDAARYFVRALQREPGHLEATSELVRLLPDRSDVDPALWSDILDVLEIDPAEIAADDSGVLPPGSMLFDVTDLLAFFGQRRLPTGIQRVQIEVSLACLEQAADLRPIFCIYASARRGWIILGQEVFEQLCRLARQSDDITDPVWLRQLNCTYRSIAVARTLRFAPKSVLVNLGTSWADRNYLLDIRLIRVRDAVIYVPIVFDLIPLINPQWFIESLVRDYRAWFGSLLHSADGYLAISDATRRDLVRTSGEWGAPVPERSVAVIRLDGDFRQEASDAALLDDYGLTPGGYVLFVSTLEPRKNHMGAFAAWLELAQALGEGAVPRLVCVGGRGWLNENLHRMLTDRPALQRMVLILHGIPDNVLATFYEHCLFALYPSLYEGWGLPVSEALSYGKIPAISRVSSLPEAGGRFARYFDPTDVTDIASTVRTMLDDDKRHQAELTIQREYTSRSWRAIVQQLVAEARGMASRIDETSLKITTSGRWTLKSTRWVEPDGSSEADVPGEALRHGRGWSQPELKGCDILGDDASLRFDWAGLPNATLHIHFAAMEHPAMVSIGNDRADTTYRLPPGETSVVSWPLPNAPTMIHLPIVPAGGNVVVARVEIVATEWAPNGTSASAEA